MILSKPFCNHCKKPGHLRKNCRNPCALPGCTSCKGKQHRCRHCNMCPSNHETKDCRNPCALPGCTGCKGKQQHFCQICGESPSGHRSKDCPLRSTAGSGTRKNSSFAVIWTVDPYGNILVQERSKNVSSSGKISIPGGKIDKGENPEKAALRELKEETGISSKDVTPLQLILKQNHANNCVTYAYTTRYTGGKLVDGKDTKTEVARWTEQRIGKDAGARHRWLSVKEIQAHIKPNQCIEFHPAFVTQWNKCVHCISTHKLTSRFVIK